MRRIISQVYWMFKTDAKQTTPYLSTCLIITLIFVLNVVSLFLLLGLPFTLSPFQFTKNEKINSWVNTILGGTFLWLIFGLLFPKKQLENYEFSNTKIVSTRKWLIIYIAFSILLMSASLIILGIKKGTIVLK